MFIKKFHGDVFATKTEKREKRFETVTAKNGMRFVLKQSVRDNVCHVSVDTDSKLGKAICFNLSILYTCDLSCECFKTGACYALGGTFMFGENQAKYTENYNFYVNSTDKEFCSAIQLVINQNKRRHLFRWFECGDIPDVRFIRCMVRIARDNPNVKFWCYTKKYSLVNMYVEMYGLESIPCNLKIVFSHWLNRDGSYFPMDNKYRFPTSEFIPMGKEYLAETVTHICPCSDPDVISHCDQCDHACYDLGFGESMALLEHSTKETRQRDKLLHSAKKALETAKKAIKKGEKK